MLLTRFADQVRERRDRPLVHLPASGRAVSAVDIWREHQTLADRLLHAGLERGRVLLSAVKNSSACAAILLACLELDAALLPLDPGATPAEIDRLAAAFGASVAIADADEGPAVTRLDGGGRYDGVAVLRLTSGSAGLPKAVMTTEAQLVSDSEHIVAAMGIRPDDTQIAAIPLSHAYGFSVILVPLLLQGTGCVVRASFVPQQLAADARLTNARVFPGAPFMFQHLIEHPPEGGWPASLTQLISAGAPLLPETARGFRERFGVKIHTFYGSTETGGITFDGDDGANESGSVGSPLPGVTLALRDVDDPCREPQAGGAGRILVLSNAVGLGYSESGGRGVEGSNETRCDGFGDGGFLTSDYGTFDEAGRLVLLGRTSSFVNVAGRKVQPAEVERVLRGMPGVADVRVVAAADARRGQQIVACVVTDRRGPAVTALGVRRFCAARLAAHKVPRAIVFFDAIPLTARGKTDREALDAAVRASLSEHV